MVKLTEDMVVARSKGSELHNIKKLNCWGSELTNVSVVRNLPNVEVLSLSVNQIATLEDFQYCKNLQELYIRKNNVSDINEVLYLRQIPKLKSLWLADNPCADFDGYRSTVLRALPHLQRLDNVTVEPEEVQQAMVCGLALPLPNSSFRGAESTEVLRSNSAGESLKSESGGGNSSLSDSSPLSSHPHQSNSRPPNGYNQSLEEGYEYTQNVYDEDEEQPQMRRTSMASQHDPDSFERKSSNAAYSSQSPPRRTSQVEPETPMETRPFSRSSSERASREQFREHSWASDSDGYNRERGYARSEDGHRQRDSYAGKPTQDFRSPSGEMRHFTQRPSSVGEVLQQHYDSTYRRVDQQIENISRAASSVDRPSPTRPYPLRPKTRNANVLSAVLCLIKELDYSSLEVVEMAIRCRMDELDD